MCKTLEKSSLLLIDLIDGVAGVFLCSYGVYLLSHGTAAADDNDINNKNPYSWIYVVILCLGGLLLLTSCLSFAGVSFEKARCLLGVSAYVGILLCLVEIVLLIVSGALKGKTIDWLKAHKGELDLDDDELATFQNVYVFYLWLLAGLCIVEVLRFKLSKHLRQWLHMDFVEYRERLLEARIRERDQEEEEEEQAQRGNKKKKGKGKGKGSSNAQQHIREKYKNKRQQYIQRHSSGGGAASAKEEVDDDDYINV